MKELYVYKKFSTDHVDVINVANDIIDEYLIKGFALTLRQLYYQFVARGLMANKQTEYKRLGGIINDARLSGRIDWEAIEDRTRSLRSVPNWSDPSGIIKSAAIGYRKSMWANQDYHVEVWIEKDALVGVIQGICNRLDLPYFACRGYNSQSEQYRAGKRFAQAVREGRTPVVLHLGDHDPSGLDMTRDNADRLALFADQAVQVDRLALNMDQIEQYGPPPNPAKLTDSRASDYIALYGSSSWELDALDPPVIERLIEDAVEPYIDRTRWDATKAETASDRAELTMLSERWEDVRTFLAT